MRILITGGAGFIGCNSAHHFLQQGHTVTIYDNLSRSGTPRNVDWLHAHHSGNFTLRTADVRDYDAVCTAVQTAAPDVVLHLAGQVAVTTSVQDPRTDFEINALGTFNLLEAVRHHAPEAIVINASTNKVYGGMEDTGIVERGDRYAYRRYEHGIPEIYPLDFHSPYGCSKGAADQYVLDYARIYGLRTVSMRQSCIYGPRQFGVEDQGWVAHFVIAAVLGRPLTIFGDGRQVRDILHVSDLINAYEAVIAQIDDVRGTAFNIGGGPQNTLSIWTEFGPLLETLKGEPIPVEYGPWRPGDQRVFIADIRRAEQQLGWKPTISPAVGIRDLYEWVAEKPKRFTD